MDGIRTPEDNEAAADPTLERGRQLTACPRCAVHASVAGSRKTMGASLGDAMGLSGCAGRLQFGLPPEAVGSARIGRDGEC